MKQFILGLSLLLLIISGCSSQDNASSSIDGNAVAVTGAATADEKMMTLTVISKEDYYEVKAEWDDEI